MDWNLSSIIVLLGFFGLGFFALVQNRPLLLLCSIPFALALNGFVYFFITIWFPIKIISIFSLFMVINNLSWMKRASTSLIVALWCLLFWLICCLIFGYIVEPPFKFGGGTFAAQSTTFRPAVQFVSYITTLSLVPLVFLALRNVISFEKFIACYAIAGLIAVGGALVELLFHIIGLEFMPILRAIGDNHQFAGFGIDNSYVYRLHSFAGEPKKLGVFLLPLLVLSLMYTVVLNKGNRPWWSKWQFIVTLFIVLITTFATSAFIGLALSTIPIVFMVLKQSGIYKMLRLAAPIIVGALGLYVALPTLSEGEFSVTELIYHRSIDRIETTYEERHETEALTYLFKDNLELSASGVGLGMYMYHLAGIAKGNVSDTIDSGWIILLLDFGLIGTILLTLIIITTSLQAYGSIQKRQDFNGYISISLVTMASATFINIGAGALPMVILWVAILAALIRINGFKNSN
ncbi:hypothetical protein MMIC_P0843 [Mariprofundus micogutta]|uniref:O-Antigen ligase n=1 Tax=Mariprofundus micogutta TaxID=1921010 RepID=A0A1L8CLW5_9PROT|nr:hypothetical protein [Mariprofundus micogutta]GAV19885.1 hypothetical protein MMIC_P0843 [Mariprofundus micogutta]